MLQEKDNYRQEDFINNKAPCKSDDTIDDIMDNIMEDTMEEKINRHKASRHRPRIHKIKKKKLIMRFLQVAVIIVLIVVGLDYMNNGSNRGNGKQANAPNISTDYETEGYDPSYPNMHDLILDLSDINKEDYIADLKSELEDTKDFFAMGDIYLILARVDNTIGNNTEYYEKTCDNFMKYKPADDEEEGILYETLASINCGERKDIWLKKAKEAWTKAGKRWRAKIIQDIIEGSEEVNSNIKFDLSEIKPILNLTGASKIVIGKSDIVIKDGELIVTQEERVLRDWLGGQLSNNPFNSGTGSEDINILKVFSEKEYYTDDELRKDIGWHEGGRLLDMMENADIKHKAAVGTIVAYDKESNSWYAPDETGLFSFTIPKDKIYYPTTRFLSKNIAVVIDTHGVNMIVEQALTSGADAVIGCCDYPGKIKAAVYLSKKGVDVFCFTDRYLDLALGNDANILGSPSYRLEEMGIVYGDRPIEIVKGQKIVVTNIEEGKGYPQQYYDAPYRYFSEINKTFPLEIYDVELKEYNQTHKVFETAEKEGASIVGYRVFNSYDYRVAKEWLENDDKNRIILFHSTAYPYGKLLAEEFPEQIGFDDPNPKVIEMYSVQ